MVGAPIRMEAHVPHAPVVTRGDTVQAAITPDRAAATSPAAPDTAPGAPLLVALDGVADLDTTLVEAAGRARATGRALLVALVEPADPLTTDPVIHARHARLRSELHVALAAAVRRRCAGLDVEVLRLRRPWALTRQRARRGLQRRLTALAHSRGAELHGSPRTTPSGRRVTDVVG